MRYIRTCALVLLLCMLTASASFARIPDDIIGTSYENPASIMVDLGIMENRDDSLFHPEEEVTRTEFAVYVYRLLGITDNVFTRYYTDVADGDPGYNEINALTGIGLMKGTAENIFSPDRFVRYEEAVKILVGMCGYEAKAIAKGGYPAGYFMLAQENKILAGVTANSGDYLSRGEVSRLLYNSMNADILEKVTFSNDSIRFEKTKGKTVLNVYSSIYLLKGILNANEHSGISMPSGACRENYVRIGATELNIGKTTANEFLGQDVEAYYHLDENTDEKTIKSIKTSAKNKITIIDSKDILEYNNGLYKYGDYERPKEIRVSDIADIIFNQKAYVGNVDNSLFVPGNGRVVLIDNNTDNRIDIVKIESYKTYFVEKINSRDFMIYDKYLQPAISIDDKDKKHKLIMDGEEVKISSIKENSVVMIYADREKNQGGISVIDDANSTLYTVVLCSEAISGEVTEVTTDNNNKQRVVINGVEYGLSADFYNATLIDPQKAPPITAGDSGTYYIDNNNLIAGTLFKKLDTGHYGFLTGLGKVTPVSENYQVKIFAYDNVMRIYELSERIDYNGTRIVASTILAGLPIKTLIHYKINDENKITGINTAVTKPDAASLQDYNQVFSLDKSFSRDVNVYNDRGILASQYRVTSDTICFMVPVDASNNVLTDKDEEFSITTLSNGRRYNNMQLYDVEPNLRINAVVLFDSSGSGGGSVGNAQDIVVVDNVLQAVNDNGENITRIVGFLGGAKLELSTKNLEIKMVSETENTNTWINNVGMLAKDLVKGDVIQYTTDTTGYVTAIRVLAHDIGNIVYGYEGINEGVTNELSLATQDNMATAAAPRLYYHESYFGIGRVETIFSDIAAVYISNKSWAEQDGTTGTDTATRYERTRTYIKGGGTIVYVFDKNSRKLSVGDFTNIEPGDYLATHIRGGNVNTMLVIKQ